MKPEEIASTIEKEALSKYNRGDLLGEIEEFDQELYKEIVNFFKDQEAPHPHLEAYEIYALVEESVPWKHKKEDIHKALQKIFEGDMGQ